MKIANMLIVLGMVLSFTGCIQPNYNPNNKAIMMLNGEAFRIPKGVTYYSHIYGNNKKDLANIKENRRLGLDCRIGDLVWLENSMDKRFKESLKGVHSAEVRRMIEPLKREAISTGKIGCARPLTDREYHHYSGQEREASANARAKRASNAANHASYMNYRAATAPKTVNMQHSGYVNVYRP